MILIPFVRRYTSLYKIISCFALSIDLPFRSKGTDLIKSTILGERSSIIRSVIPRNFKSFPFSNHQSEETRKNSKYISTNSSATCPPLPPPLHRKNTPSRAPEDFRGGFVSFLERGRGERGGGVDTSARRLV